ncbi:DUF4249 domain-containing protein [Runella sp.]|jgi:hypothetical protein|uniref:DUF4249 domain-containing protein n=1 Tax=Runella sp. TaxID=1960881 RepID=UPI00262A0F4C|nr:DUF4249 domain-containing protein [Runella sp.]
MKWISILTLLFVGFLLLDGCVLPFSPPEVASADRFLVVDGFLNTNGKDSSRITLTYTQVVSNKNTFSTELKAQIIVEGDKGSTFTFTEIGKGLYRLAPRTFNAAENYRIRIKTTGKKEYLSEYVAPKQTPPIDSVTYKIASDKKFVQINVNTHDALNKTNFYRWKFEETWEYNMPQYSLYEIKNNAIIDRVENINTCWKTETPSSILLASTIKLSQDVIRDAPITNIPTATNKLLIKYSILVKQFGLTEEGFKYWSALAKTTETTGGLFDAQPSQVTGNIKCTTNPQELVFGFFNAGVPQEKRVFLSLGLGLYSQCAPFDTVSRADAIKGQYFLLSQYFAEGSSVADYIVGDPGCGDCRTKGGITKRPSFW